MICILKELENILCDSNRNTSNTKALYEKIVYQLHAQNVVIETKNETINKP